MVKKLHFLLFLILVAGHHLIAQHTPMLWGLTAQGGNDDLGTIYHFNPANNTHYLDHSFANNATGANPEKNDMVNGGGGKYYGMTTNGGLGFCGAIFEWDSTTNIYTQKYNFNSIDGNFPKGSLFLYGGKFYGMTSFGGVNNKGVIFEWNPVTNVYTKKIDLSSSTGGNPTGSLALYGVKLYGMTSTGGTNNKGVIFEWDPNTNVYTTKYNFISASGTTPYGSLVLQSGKFYGMTYTGGSNNCGVIFEWDPASGVYSKKVDLAIATGKNPYSDLTYYGTKFYGLTSLGGVNSCGVIFEWNPVSNVYVKKYDLSLANGSYPHGSLAISGTKLYGLTHDGGVNGLGVIFEWNPATNVYVKKKDLNVSLGNNPFGSMTLIGNDFYGLTNKGGAYDLGVIFKWTGSTNTLVKKFDFNSNNNAGNEPDGSLTFYSGKFYGMTNRGGAYDRGVIFEWNPLSNTYTKKIDFDSLNGGNPQGRLVLNGTKFYGLTSAGGTNNKGVIFEWDPATNNYAKQIDLTLSGGASPYGSMTLYNSKFYGMTDSGGVNNVGTIFEWDPSTNTFTKKIDLSFVNGCSPYGGLALSGTKLYGMTNSGGTDSLGVIFEWDPASNVYTKKLDLDTLTGGAPYGSMVLNGPDFYGFTFNGGSYDLGTIFKWNPSTNVFTKEYDFDDINGSNPLETPLFAASGKLYGTTSFGGAASLGTLFEWNPSSGIFSKKLDFYGAVSPVPGAFPRLNQLVEATVNQIPVFSYNNSAAYICVNSAGTDTFDLTDADNDPMTLTIASSNTSLLPVTNISITHTGGSNYLLAYTPVAGQTGNSVITITANDGFGGVVLYNYTLYVRPLPLITISSSSAALCEGLPETLTASGASTYTWTNGIVNGIAFYPSVTTTYSVTATDVYGCANTSSVIITVYNINANAGIDDSICYGGSITFNASPSGAGYTYNWSSSFSLSDATISNPIATPASTTSYVVTINDGNGCTDRDTVVLNVDPQLNASAAGVNSSCYNSCDGMATVIPTGGTSPYNYLWDSGCAAPGCSNLCAGNYIVMITDAYGCVISAPVTITQPAPVDVTVSQGANDITANLGGATYQWIDCDSSGQFISGATSQNYMPFFTGNYAVIVEDGNGCSDTSSCYNVVSTGVNSSSESIISVYPNPSSGTFHINTGEENEIQIKIINMLGQVLYEKELTQGVNEINISDFSDGSYFIMLKQKDKSVIRKRIELIR